MNSCLYVNPGFTERINELPPAEGEAILGFLYEHCTSERFVYRHRWSRHDVVLHPLKGDRAGQWSVRVSGNWRVALRFEDGEAVDVDLID